MAERKNSVVASSESRYSLLRPMNIHLDSMSMSLSKTSDEEFEMYCETCNREGKRINASAFCISCLSFFCSSCLQSHEKFLLDHKYVEGQYVPKDVCLEKCKIHCREIVKFYCEKCKLFACIMCKRESHKHACSLKYLPHFVKDIEKEDDFKELFMKKEILSKRMKDVKSVYETRQKRLTNFSSNAKTAIENEKHTVFSDFDKKIEQIEAQIKAKQDKDSQRIGIDQRQTILISSKIDKFIGDVKKSPLIPKHKKYKHFIEMKHLHEEIKEYEDKARECLRDDDELESDIEKSVDTLTERIQRFGMHMRMNRDRYHEAEEDVTKTASHIKDINIKGGNDVKDCFVTDSFLFSDEYLVVCDKSNKAIKLVNIKSEKVKHKSLWTVPESLARIDNSQFALVRQYENDEDTSIIQFLTINEAKQLVFQKRKILTEMYCYAIASYQQKELIIAMSKSHEGKIQILSFNGKILANLELDTNGDKKIFRCPFSITVDEDEEVAYVSDWYKDVIVTVDLDDHTCTKLSTKVWHPRGVAIDEDDFIYIVESGTNSIQYIDTEDKKHVLIEGKSEDLRPCCITYCIKEKRLYVGQKKLNCIKVYQIDDSWLTSDV